MQEELSERRGRARDMIERMLHERREVLVLLLRVSGVAPYHNETPLATRLDEFRQMLTDYIASAHFGLYARIAAGNERRQPVLDVARRIYPTIAETTDAAVRFADKYESLHLSTGSASAGRIPRELQGDLSRLGEILATRIELEDELIGALLGEVPSLEVPRRHASH